MLHQSTDQKTSPHENDLDKHLVFMVLPKTNYAYCEIFTSIQIFNVNGNKLIDFFHRVNKLSREIKLDLSQYPTGVYFINLSAENLKETIKLIKY